MFIGDSVTEGFSVTPAQRWSSRVATALGVVESNAGISGTVLQNVAPVQTNNGRDRVAAAIISANLPGRLFISFGINDTNASFASFTPENYQSTLVEILKGVMLYGMERTDVVVVGPSYVDPTAWATAPAPYNAGSEVKYTAYRQAAQAAAMACKCKFVDTYSYMQSRGGSSLLLADKFHPNVQGHQAIADAVMAAIA